MRGDSVGVARVDAHPFAPRFLILRTFFAYLDTSKNELNQSGVQKSIIRRAGFEEGAIIHNWNRISFEENISPNSNDQERFRTEPDVTILDRSISIDARASPSKSESR